MGQESGRRPKVELDQRDAKDGEAPDEHKVFNLTVGEAIRRSRQEHGWTQAFLAEQAGLSPNYIARLERGELGPSLFVANRICDALSTDLEMLVTPSPAGTVTGMVARRTSKRKAANG